MQPFYTRERQGYRRPTLWHFFGFSTTCLSEIWNACYWVWQTLNLFTQVNLSQVLIQVTLLLATEYILPNLHEFHSGRLIFHTLAPPWVKRCPPLPPSCSMRKVLGSSVPTLPTWGFLSRTATSTLGLSQFQFRTVEPKEINKSRPNRTEPNKKFSIL